MRDLFLAVLECELHHPYIAVAAALALDKKAVLRRELAAQYVIYLARDALEKLGKILSSQRDHTASVFFKELFYIFFYLACKARRRHHTHSCAAGEPYSPIEFYWLDYISLVSIRQYYLKQQQYIRYFPKTRKSRVFDS